jgi:Leucine-rich repeat (LRR) protein
VPIDRISANIINLTKLNYLNLNQTNISEIPKEIGKLKQLRDLQLSSVNKPVLPNEQIECKNLEEVGLNNCEKLDFSQAFEVITTLPSLNNLNLSLNSITGLADKIARLKNLEILDVSNTDLTYEEIKLILDNCKKLKEVIAIIEGLTPEQKKRLEKRYKNVAFRFKWF